MPKLNIKLSNGTSKEVTLDSLTDGTVMDLKKNVLAPAIDIPAENQRVVYKGRILKDGDALTAVGLLDGVALHVVRSGAAPATAAAPSTTAPAPTPQQQQQQQDSNNTNNNNTTDASSSNNNANAANPNPFASLFGGVGVGAGGNNNQQQQQQQGGGGAPNPFASMMGGGMGGLGGMMGGMGGAGGNINPNQMAAAAQMMQNNPQMQQMMQQLIQNPQMMRQVLQMDPTINSMPEPQRSQTLDLMTNPLMLQGMMSSFGGGGGGMGGANPFAAMMGGAGGNNNSNSDQQPQGGTGAGAGVPPPPPQAMPQAPQMSTEEARTRYSSQLQQLQTMGFPNEDANIRALIMSQGNVDFAVARLLGD